MPGTLDGSTYQIEAYLSDGTFLWSKDLGQGIEPVFGTPLSSHTTSMEMAKQKLP